MAMLKLPSDIQSLFCASTQICSYKRAVEELVYNSLDAESTSIAVRVNIEQNTIQVIDNGCGVSKCSFSLIGQRHATSKCVDLSTLKSIPNKYGYRGQSLASIIEVSQSVKVTSRCHDSEETWIKTFHKGKEQKLCVGAQRPSEGTTIDIKGFLYNLKIQKKAIDSLNELNEIKAFLEQLSLVHNNISLSLRDDAKNEIIFQLHKNRDIYQTLGSMFEIERSDFQELKVEKNNYKVSAFIGKKDKEMSSKHWIYLNGKYLQSKKLQKIVNDHFIKSLKLNQQNRKKVKSKNLYDHEDDSHQKCIPFYFIFISCPYYDYDINQVSKHTVVEFKDWELINKLIEKMVKLYAGDINMKEIGPVKNQVVDQQKTNDTRDQVKKIMHKILGSHSRRIGVSQMQNGIKGKITKRKPKNNGKILNLKDKRVGSKQENKITKRKEKPVEEILEEIRMTSKEVKPPKVSVGNVEEKKVTAQKKNIPCESAKTNHNNKDKVCENNNNKTNYIRMKPHETTRKKYKTATYLDDTSKKNKLTKNINRKTTKANTEHLQKSKMATKNKSVSKKTERTKKRTDKKKLNKPKLKTKNFINFFAQDPTGSVKRRCKILANKIDDLMSYKKKRKRKIFINETVQYSNIIKDNKNYSIRKKIDEIVIHDYIPKPPTYIPCTFDDRVWDKTQKEPCKSSYDLMKTILRTQEIRNSCREIHDVEENDKEITPLENMTIDDDDISTRNHDKIFEAAYEDLIDDSPNISLLPRLTFDSHNYVKHCNQISHNYNIQSYTSCEKPKEKSMRSRFITKQSKENFVIPTIKSKIIKKWPTAVKLNNIEFQSNNLHKFTKQVESHQESSYTIEFSKSNDNVTASRRINIPSHLNETQIENATYTIDNNYKINDEIYLGVGSTYTIDDTYNGNGSEGAESIDYIEDSTEKVVHGHLSKNDLTLENGANGNCNGYLINKNNNHEDCLFRENVDYLENNNNDAVQSQLNPNDMLFDNDNSDLKNRQPEPQNSQLKMNVVFISKSQEEGKSKDVEIQTTIDKQIIPLNICETVLSQDNDQENTSHIEWNDSLFNADFEVDSFLCDRDVYTLRDCFESIDKNEINVNMSSKFAAWNKTALENVAKSIIGEENPVNSANELNETTLHKHDNPVNVMKKDLQNVNERNSVQEDSNHFNFKNRLRFVPKGMSQIFTKCQSRNMSDYNPGKDYYEEAIYNDFANNIHMNCEILEPGVQSIKELTTKAIDKVNYKLNKDNASLIFNGKSLKQAKVLKQIDNKFIAAKITGRSHHSSEITEYLVLFDQHAVHERIRLETNLNEYFNGNEWKSMPLDDVKLKVSKDEILYLHNYRNKFTQLGLQWTVLRNGEVAINAIPLAILGKNPRQVEIVIKAVRSLIVEEINAIKSQSGCISLYPKAIMDLVFSEACRYAIKFGDRLSKDECVDLLTSLSECKTPFQCAHGRPVMAVLMDIKADDNKKYEINMKSIQKWKRVKEHNKK